MKGSFTLSAACDKLMSFPEMSWLKYIDRPFNARDHCSIARKSGSYENLRIFRDQAAAHSSAEFSSRRVSALCLIHLVESESLAKGQGRICRFPTEQHGVHEGEMLGRSLESGQAWMFAMGFGWEWPSTHKSETASVSCCRIVSAV